MRRLGFPVKETDQGCSLVQLKRHGSLTQHRLRLGQELARELGAMGWSGTAHGWHPVALTIWVSIRQSPVYQTRQGNLIVICETDHLALRSECHTLSRGVRSNTPRSIYAIANLRSATSCLSWS